MRIIYLIHGDGNYLFHDIEGQAFNAAEEVLKEAITSGENIIKGEVFIFYKKPAGNVFLFFPQDEAEFFYFRNGSKIAGFTYSGKDSAPFETESELIKKYSASLSDSIKNIMLYYGHEIPAENIKGYDQSFPEREFGIPIFAEGVREILSSLPDQANKFDLIVLSTCRNGNLKTAELLSASAKHLIASPGDIHLSHLNSLSLIQCMGKNMNAQETALKFADNAFNTMIRKTSTEVCISVYDLEKISPGIDKYPPAGIINFYRPPLFGRKLILNRDQNK